MAEFPTLTVEVAFSTDPRTRPGAMDWTDVSTDNAPIEALSIERGIDMKTSRIEAGVCRMTLDNSNRELDPSNGSSSYSPNVKPRKRVRVVADPPEGGEAARTLFTGFVERWPIQWEAEIGRVRITASDLLALVADDVLPFSVLEAVITRLTDDGAAPSSDIAHYWPLAESFGTTAPDLVGGVDGSYWTLVTGGVDSAVPYDPRPGQVFAYRSSGAQAEQQVTIDAANWNGLSTWVELWYRLDHRGDSSGPGDGGYYELFRATQTDDDDSYFLISIEDADGTLRVHYNGSGYGGSEYVIPQLFDGNGHHIYVGNSGDGAGVFVDGVLQYVAGEPVAVPGFTWSGFDRANIKIGQAITDDGASIDDPWTHCIGHVVVGTAAPTTAIRDEMLAHHTAGVSAWDGDTTAERLERILDLLGIDDDDRDIASATAERCGPTVLDTQNALEYLRKIAATERSPLFVSGDGKITFPGRLANTASIVQTFSDDGSDIPYADIGIDYSLDRVINVAQVKREGGITQTEDDSDSQDDYGILNGGLGVIETLHRSPAGARSLAVELVTRNSEPRLVINNVLLDARDDDVTVAAAYDLDLGDAATIEATPPGGGSAISQDCYVERIEQDLRDDLRWNIRIGLSEHVVLPDFAWDTASQGWDEAVWSEP